MLHLVIPSRNEAPYITNTLHRLAKTLADLPIPWQIIVADNGSTDNTHLTVDEFRISNFEFREKLAVIRCPKVGKGSAIRYSALQLPITNYQLPITNERGFLH